MAQPQAKAKATRKRKVDMTQENEEIIVDQSVEEVEEEVEEEVDTELPLGEDPSALFASSKEKTLEIEFAGKRWQFKYRQMTWGEKNYCIDKAQTWDASGGFTFSVATYYAAALTKMLTDTPIRPITETTLNRLDREIGEALVSIVPQPVEQGVANLKVL